MPPGLVSCIPAKTLRNYLLFFLSPHCFFDNKRPYGNRFNFVSSDPALSGTLLSILPLMNDSFLISVQIDILDTSSLGLTK